MGGGGIEVKGGDMEKCYSLLDPRGALSEDKDV